MSPFAHADRVKDPILLIHGMDDANSGTHYMQSERFFAALVGHGADARFVSLPHEGHGMRGYESVLHVLAEISDFLDAHTAPNKATPAETNGNGSAAHAPPLPPVVAAASL